MKITKVECFALLIPDFDADACSSAQDNLIVKIHADNGLFGIGETVGAGILSCESNFKCLK